MTKPTKPKTEDQPAAIAAEDQQDKPPMRAYKEQSPDLIADDALLATCKELSEYGIAVNFGNVDMNNINARVSAGAALRLLIKKGIVTEAEAGAQMQETLRELLDGLLELVQYQAKQARRSALMVARSPQDITAVAGQLGKPRLLRD